MYMVYGHPSDHGIRTSWVFNYGNRLIPIPLLGSEARVLTVVPSRTPLMMCLGKAWVFHSVYPRLDHFPRGNPHVSSPLGLPSRLPPATFPAVSLVRRMAPAMAT